MMNSAYHLELNTSYSFIRNCLEKMKQFVTAMRPTEPINYDWKCKVANEVLDSLSQTRLTKNICYQVSFRQILTNFFNYLDCFSLRKG